MSGMDLFSDMFLRIVFVGGAFLHVRLDSEQASEDGYKIKYFYHNFLT